MKTLPLITCFFLMSFGLTANTGVPQVVKDAFFQLYPEVNSLDVYWESGEEAVVATFQDNGRLTKAFFDKAGKWRESHIRLYQDQMPQPIRNFLEKQLREADVTFAGKVLFPDGSSVFRIETEYFEEVVIKLMDKKGALLKEEHIPFTEGLEVY